MGQNGQNHMEPKGPLVSHRDPYRAICSLGDPWELKGATVAHYELFGAKFKLSDRKNSNNRGTSPTPFSPINVIWGRKISLSS
jgi:hypothetical protein